MTSSTTTAARLAGPSSIRAAAGREVRPGRGRLRHRRRRHGHPVRQGAGQAGPEGRARPCARRQDRGASSRTTTSCGSPLGLLRSRRDRASTDPARRLPGGGRAIRGALVAADGRSVAVDEAVHLPPVEPTKIICVHLNYASRVARVHAPSCRRRRRTSTSRSRRSTPTAATSCGPSGCHWLNYEGEIAIVIGRTCRNVAPADAARLHRRVHDRQRLRPARLPRHRRRVDAAGQGLRHALPDRARRS